MNFPSRSLWKLSFTHVLVADGHVKTRLKKHTHTYNRTTQALFVSLSQGKQNAELANFCVSFPATFRTHTACCAPSGFRCCDKQAFDVSVHANVVFGFSQNGTKSS